MKYKNKTPTTNKDEKHYIITPKGIAVLSMLQTGLIQSSDDQRFEGFWTLFTNDMKRLGYLTEK